MNSETKGMIPINVDVWDVSEEDWDLLEEYKDISNGFTGV